MKKVFILGAATGLFALVPLNTNAATATCRTDQQVATFARQRVNETATDLQRQLRMPAFASFPDQMKQQIDSTSLHTGGKLRDIYVGGASVQDKKDMVQEFLLSRLGGIEQQARSLAEQKADSLVNDAQGHLNRAALMKDDSHGNGNATRSLSPVRTFAQRSGSFKLQQRNWIGLFEDAGRFNYTVTVRNTVSVQQIRFNETYNTCPNNNTIDNSLSYGTKVVVTPVLEVRYAFNTLGSSRNRSRYHAFSGSFTILGQQDQVVRELAEDRVL